jgi:molybdate transport system ATP-binding protein
MISVALRKDFPGFTLDVAFAAPTPGVVALFGPSGAGKSSIVAGIAGLLRPDAGEVVVDGVVLSDAVPVERRRLGLVFQDARLFPHMNVETNLRYGLRRAPAGEIGFDAVVGLLGLERLLDRRPHSLSGGERQRVAIGRALLSQPRLLLLDEPLASLDAARKAEILPYLLRLKTALKLPIIYVTHALDEVFALADTLVLLDAGRVVASGPVAELSSRADLPLAVRDDAASVFDAVVADHHPARRLSLLRAGTMQLWVPLVAAAVGQAMRVRIPAREIILATEAPNAISLHNIIPGVVQAIHIDAARHAALVEIDAGAALLARVTPDAVARLGLKPGSQVLALVKSMSVDVRG